MCAISSQPRKILPAFSFASSVAHFPVSVCIDVFGSIDGSILRPRVKGEENEGKFNWSLTIKDDEAKLVTEMK